MARVLIHDQLPRALQGLEQPFRVLKGAQLVGFAGEAQIRYADFLGVPFPGERLAEFVEAVFVGEPRHVHEALLEGGGGFLEDRVAAGLEARTRHRDRAVTRLARDGDRAEEGAEAGADDADAGGIDLGSRREPAHHRAAGRHPVRRAHAMPEHRAFVLARRSEEHTSELQSHVNLVCRLLLEKKKKKKYHIINKKNKKKKKKKKKKKLQNQ